MAGLTYRIQVTGFLIDSVGTFNLAVLGSNGPLVEVPGTTVSLPGSLAPLNQLLPYTVERSSPCPDRAFSRVLRVH